MNVSAPSVGNRVYGSQPWFFVVQRDGYWARFTQSVDIPKITIDGAATVLCIVS